MTITRSFQIARSIAKSPDVCPRSGEGGPDEVSKEFRAASRDLFGFTAFDKYFERVGPYCLEQPPAAGRSRSNRCYQRLGDQICDLLEENGCGV